MPRTGGGSAPDLPFLPMLVGLGLIGLGGLTRRLGLLLR
jgi:hypothetical protein